MDDLNFDYYRELSPNFMRWCLLLNGIVAPELTEESCHCELGFGQGVSANINAAATPGKFFGNDFNPAHAAQAKEFAKASGAEAKFFEDSFEEFSKRDDLPQFDSIGVHGVWSFVDAENRGHILEIARRHLKSGGMFYNSYNCLPGAAPHAPLRELLAIGYRYKTNPADDAEERINSAMNFVEDLLDANPAYLKVVPSFKNRFEQIKREEVSYIAHEYLNSDWDLMYFKDVAELFKSAKLDFAATAIPIESKEDMFLPERMKNFLKRVDNPIAHEQLQDYFINRHFRKDIFVRGLRRLSTTEVYDKILMTRYVLNKPAADVPMNVSVHLGDLNLDESLYRPLLEYLERDNFRPKYLQEYFMKNNLSAGSLIELITILVYAGHVLPCQDESAVKQVKKSCEQLNAHICERSEFGETINVLASPLTGGGVEVGRFQQLFLAQYKAGSKTSDRLADEVWKIISRNHERMIVSDVWNSERFLETPEENIAHLKNLAEDFLSKLLPIYKALLL